METQSHTETALADESRRATARYELHTMRLRCCGALLSTVAVLLTPRGQSTHVCGAKVRA